MTCAICSIFFICSIRFDSKKKCIFVLVVSNEHGALDASEYWEYVQANATLCCQFNCILSHFVASPKCPNGNLKIIYSMRYIIITVASVTATATQSKCKTHVKHLKHSHAYLKCVPMVGAMNRKRTHYLERSHVFQCNSKRLALC